MSRKLESLELLPGTGRGPAYPERRPCVPPWRLFCGAVCEEASEECDEFDRSSQSSSNDSYDSFIIANEGQSGRSFGPIRSKWWEEHERNLERLLSQQLEDFRRLKHLVFPWTQGK